MRIKLTKLQAYNVMLNFLEELYKEEKSDYLGNILSNSEFLADKIPGDRASWVDWKHAISITALQDKNLRNHNRLTELQACCAMYNYVHNYTRFYLVIPEHFVNLLKQLQLLQTKKNKPMWQKWLTISDIIVKKNDPRVYLQFIV